MTIRESVEDLVLLVRQHIGDLDPVAEAFDDLAVQRALDDNRRDLQLIPLTGERRMLPGGILSTTTYWSREGGWEADAILQGVGYAYLTPTTSDPLAGWWTFAVSTPDPVYLTGKQHDHHAAAADLLEDFVAVHMTDFDFLAAGRTFKRSQVIPQIEARIALLRQRQRLRISEMIRTDMTGA